MFDWVKNRLLAKGLKYRAHLFPQIYFYKLSRENTQPENMCDIVFEKVKGRGGTVNSTSVYSEAAVQRVL